MQIFIQGVRPVMAFEKLTVSSSSVGLTATVYQVSNSGTTDLIKAKLAVITIETNPIRIRFDGTAPTSTTGHLFNAGDTIELQSQRQIENFRAIATGSDATVQVTYFGG